MNPNVVVVYGSLFLGAWGVLMLLGAALRMARDRGIDIGNRIGWSGMLVAVAVWVLSIMYALFAHCLQC